MNLTRFMSACAALPLLFALAGQAASGGIMVSNAVIVQPVVPTGKTAAGYVMLMNHGSESDVLVGVDTTAAEYAELHKSVETDGVMTMRKVDRLEVPAGAMIDMESEGLHIMLVRPIKPLVAGDDITLTFRFEKQQPITVHAVVSRVKQGGDHSGHTVTP